MQLGQSRTLPVEKPEQIDLAQAARYFGARGEADTATMAPVSYTHLSTYRSGRWSKSVR